MLNPFSRVTMVAVLAVVSLITTADAQRLPQAPKVAKQPITLHPGNGSSGDGVDGGLSPYSYGWNYVHATNCYIYDEGVGWPKTCSVFYLSIPGRFTY
jgi:hypothetical protein